MREYQPRSTHGFRHFGSAVPGVLLTILVLASFLGVVLHVAWAEHDPGPCPICTWFAAHGWILVFAAFLAVLTSEGLVTEYRARGVSRSHLPPQSRSPPAVQEPVDSAEWAYWGLVF